MIRDALDTAHPTALYVHIPFCRSRCFYCDFTTWVAPKPEVEAYVHWLQRELALRGRETEVPLQSVFFGGGTPTYLSATQLDAIFRALHEHFTVDPAAEITVEANPGTVTPDKLQVLRQAGVNRLSFGAQTMDDNLLMAIGRTHDADTAVRSVEMARAHGFERINLDLMFGLPDQNLASVERAVRACVDLGIDHVSAYWLKVEEGTPFARWEAEGLLPLPGEDAEGEMYEAVRNLLSDAGLQQYEVSNFARPGEASRHNLVYWHNQPYIAAGVGAHGYVHGERYENVTSLSDYARHLAGDTLPEADRFVVSAEESAENAMMLGLRLREGVSIQAFTERYGIPPTDVFDAQIQRLTQKGLLVETGDRIQLTERAWPIANVVFEPFVGALTLD